MGWRPPAWRRRRCCRPRAPCSRASPSSSAIPRFWSHAATTLFRLFVGFGIAVVVGVTAGVAATGSRTFGALLRPVVRVLAPVPKIALYPAFILILGFEHASKIALVAADAVFPILLATYQGTSAVEPKLVWSALAAGTSRRKALFTVVLPAALPSVLTGCRIGLVISCIVVFLAEMITSTDGLGHLLIYAARSFETVDMFVPLITISLLGLALNAAFNALQRAAADRLSGRGIVCPVCGSKPLGMLDRSPPRERRERGASRRGVSIRQHGRAGEAEEAQHVDEGLQALAAVGLDVETLRSRGSPCRSSGRCGPRACCAR